MCILLLNVLGSGKLTPVSAHALVSPLSSNIPVLTQKYNNMRTGWNPYETLLNTSNVNASQFGRLITYPVDGQVYAQPLYVPGVSIGGTVHNVVIVATEHDSVYAFDADARPDSSGTAPPPLWHTSFLASGVTSVSSNAVSCSDISPEYGITGTPVIDPATGTLYLVAVTSESGQVVTRVHALDITTGQDRLAPVVVQATVRGSGAGSVNGVVSFDSRHEGQRMGLLLLNGVVYAAFGSHCDNTPYHGWILGYSASSLSLVSVYNDTPNGSDGGIWEAGEGLSADENNFIYYVSGNGSFDLSSGGADASDSFVKLQPSGGSLRVVDYFTPFNQSCLSAADRDLGSGGPLLVPGTNSIIGVGKEGRLYVVNRANMGRYHTIANACSNQALTNVDTILQEFPPGTVVGGVWGSESWWNGPTGQMVYTAGVKDHLKAWAFSKGLLATHPGSQAPEALSYPGGVSVISSNGSVPGTGIVWMLEREQLSNGSLQPWLRAYDATNLNHELYSDVLPSYSKFSVPTVANGKVFVGTHESLLIYGLLNGGQPLSGFNNVGITDDSAPQKGNFDGSGNSYSAQALQQAGIAPGSSVTFNGVTFTWPAAAAGDLDNYAAGGQTVEVTPVPAAATLAFLGAASVGPSSGTITVNFSDSTSQSYTLGFSDWTLNGGTASPSFGNKIVVTMPYRNTPAGRQAHKTYIFYAELALPPGKTLQSVTLPLLLNQGTLHIFAIGTKNTLPTPPYSNTGTSDDSNTKTASFDTSGNSYSAQALQAASPSIVPGGSVSFNGVTFTWPAPGSGQPNNYQASGQLVSVSPVSAATRLAFLGAATNGPSTGTFTIGYTDGTTQAVQLTFSDWTLHGDTQQPAPGNQVLVKLPYRNTPTGRQTRDTYVFYVEVPIAPGKTVASVQLPSSVSAGQLHVFALAAA
jgi:hypothetical protein